MLPSPIHSAPLRFALAGTVLAFGAPVGWRLVSIATGEPEGGAVLFLYLTLSTVLVFSAFGLVLGTLYDRLRRAAERDDLTGLFNQNAFLRTATVLVQLAVRHKEPISVLMMDIDHFKEVNDHHNHLVGSHVLKEIARIIDRGVRRSDLTARFGGDEYVFCLPRTDQAEAHMISERLRSEIGATTFVYGQHKVRVTVSIGVATVKGAAAMTISRLIETADQALYAAKHAGRNQVIDLQVAG